MENAKEKRIEAIKKQNENAKRKISELDSIIKLLEIRKKGFINLSNFRIFPAFLRAKWRLKVFSISNEISAKHHFIQLYSERMVNEDYLKSVMSDETPVMKLK